MITLYNNCPTLDLHGEPSDIASVLINDFIKENYTMGKEFVIIIHGIGTGILKKTTAEVLKKNRLVDSFKIDNFNAGETIVKLRKRV